MFNSVQLVRGICKEKGIPISLLEKECGFANGYFNPRKLTKLPYDCAVLIADYFGVTPEYLLTGGDSKKAPATSGERYDGLSVLSDSDGSLTPSEWDLIRKYRSLDSRGQAAVMNILNFEYNSFPGDISVSSSQNA